MTRTRNDISRLVAIVATILGLVAGALALGFSSPAAADTEPGPTQYGYKKVLNPSHYMIYYRASGTEVLHIDKEHADADGFWLAAKTTGGRGLIWHYQPYGQWCAGNSNMKVEWNGWLNSYTCMPRPEMLASAYPEWWPRTQACRQETGYPWKQDALQVTQQCTNNLLDLRYNPIAQSSPTYTDVCAPWEDQGLAASGAPLCVNQTYPWQNNTPNSEQVFWTASPDTCTQMPADSNRRYPLHDPSLYAPVTGGDGTCTGEAFAPNCETAPEDIRSTVRACTGLEEVPPIVYSATATAIESASADVYVTRSHRSTAKGVRYTKTVRVTLKHKGRKYRGKGTFRVVRSVSRTVTKTGKFTGRGTATITQTCSSLVSQANANTCAQQSAKSAAVTAARAAAVRSARNIGIARLHPQVVEAARLAAQRALAAVTVSKPAKRAAAKKAKAIAVKKAKRKFRR